jgi:hypothetical protein
MHSFLVWAMEPVRADFVGTRVSTLVDAALAGVENEQRRGSKCTKSFYGVEPAFKLCNPSMQRQSGGGMAKTARQPVTIHYRRLEDVTGAFGKQTLEAAIRKAMSHRFDGGKIAAHWKRRAWVVPPSSEDTLLMNIHHDGGSYYFGDLTHYTKGYLQTLLVLLRHEFSSST